MNIEEFVFCVFIPTPTEEGEKTPHPSITLDGALFTQPYCFAACNKRLLVCRFIYEHLHARGSRFFDLVKALNSNPELEERFADLVKALNSNPELFTTYVFPSLAEAKAAVVIEELWDLYNGEEARRKLEFLISAETNLVCDSIARSRALSASPQQINKEIDLSTNKETQHASYNFFGGVRGPHFEWQGEGRHDGRRPDGVDRHRDGIATERLRLPTEAANAGGAPGDCRGID